MTGLQASEILKELTKVERAKLKLLILDTAKTYNFSDRRLQEIISLLHSLKIQQSQILTTLIVRAFNDTVKAEMLKFPEYSGINIDPRVASVLAQDTVRDLTKAIEQSQKFITSSFKLAKQDILSESKISEVVLDRLMEEGNFRQAAKDLSIEIDKVGRGATSQTRNLTEREILQRIHRAEDSLFKTGKIPGYLKTKVMDRVEQKLRDGRFITILSKRLDGSGNRIPYTYSLDYYTSMVARTRVGDSQVQASIETGQRIGAELYKVTSHNTTSEICKQFEGKYLTQDPKLVGKTYQGIQILLLTDESRPLYHPNCKHRLLVFPLTEREYAEITGAKYIAA